MPEAASLRCVIASNRFPVIALQGHESLSQPFDYQFTLVDTDMQLLGNELIGQPASLVMQDAQGNLRSVTGCIARLEQELAEFTIQLTPLLARGAQVTQTRLFLGKTRRQLVDQVLEELGYAAHQIEWHGTVSEGSLPLNLLQAGETHLNFINRLLAEMGCFYWFDSNQDEERFCIAQDFVATPFSAPLLSLDEQRRASMAGKDSPLTMSWHHVPPSIQVPMHTRPSQPVHGLASGEHAVQEQLLPLTADAKTQAEQQDAQHKRALQVQFELVGHFPVLVPGYSTSIPPFWRKDQGSDDLTVVAISHQAEAYDANNAQLGVRHTQTIKLIKRASGYRPKFPKMPKLPAAFPARIESAGKYAHLDERGQYQLRMGFTAGNTEQLEHTHASPAVERMVPFANADTELNTGWHFPLLDRSTVLVTLLNNDPNRACVLGFASESGQEGPVTNENAHQARIVTPGQNELTFDDELPSILLQTFDGQTKLELNAQSSGPYISIAAQYGLISLSAGQMQKWMIQEDLIQKHGGAFLEKVKTNSTVTVDGNRHLQAAKQQILRSKNDTTLTSDANQHWQTKTGGMTFRSEDAYSITSQGAQLTKVSDGNYFLQAPNDVSFTGTGNGNLLVSNGTGGFQIDSGGNIKLFGKQVSMKGQSGVTFDGDVEYELGASNEAESADAIEPVEVEGIEALEFENVAVEGEASRYEWEQNQYETPEEHEQTRDVVVSIRSELGSPVPKITATFMGDQGFQAEGESDEKGKITFTTVPKLESGKIVYADEMDLLHKSLAADIYFSLSKKKQRKLARCLHRSVDYTEVKKVFEDEYGDIEALLVKKFKHPDTQEHIQLLLINCGWLDSVDNMEVFYCE